MQLAPINYGASTTNTSPQFTSRILKWYAINARKLPWRGKTNPYRVWISEVMLQQTRVETVVPYYLRWIKQFPNLRSLAAAREHDVLRQWEGLGYYSRARNLRRAAQEVVERFGGRIPENPAILRTLPGIGKYTAGAISSIAFGCHTPAVDGNVSRVLARVFKVTVPVRSPAGQRIIWQLATAHLPDGRVGDFNQGLMDLGAGICLPRLPRCNICPLRKLCQANLLGAQARIPVLGSRKPRPHHTVAAAVIKKRGRVLIAQRPSGGLLGGMWEFPNTRILALPEKSGQASRDFTIALEGIYGLKIRSKTRLGMVQHEYSHFRITTHAFTCEVKSMNGKGQCQWVRIRELDSFPMGKVDRHIARTWIQ